MTLDLIMVSAIFLGGAMIGFGLGVLIITWLHKGLYK